MDGFGFLDEFSKFPKILHNELYFMLTSSNDPNDIEH
jgi:hypothetical protein